MATACVDSLRLGARIFSESVVRHRAALAHLSVRVYLGEISSKGHLAWDHGWVSQLSFDAEQAVSTRRVGARGWTAAGTIVAVVLFGFAGWPGWWWKLGSGLVHPDVLADALALAEVGALLVWRASPLVCFALAEAALVSYGVLGYPSTPAGYAGLVATAVAAWGVNRAWARYACLGLAVGGILAIGLSDMASAGRAGIATNVVLVLTAWLFGRIAGARADAAALRVLAVDEATRRKAAEHRLALAASLHDGVGRILVGVLRQMEAAQVVGGHKGVALMGRVSERLREAVSAITAVVASESRYVSASSPATVFVPPLIEAERPGLLAGVLGQWLDTLATAEVSVELSLSGSPASLDHGAEAIIAAVVCEALANVARHSAAGGVALGLAFCSGEASVSVCDPGPARGGTVGAGTGIARLRKMLVHAGGGLDAAADPSGGFLLEAHLPLSVPSSDTSSPVPNQDEMGQP
ncbi:MAG: sensor histidine kinase [Acidimicrobiales bacterium]